MHWSDRKRHAAHKPQVGQRSKKHPFWGSLALKSGHRRTQSLHHMDTMTSSVYGVTSSKCCRNKQKTFWQNGCNRRNVLTTQNGVLCQVYVMEATRKGLHILCCCTMQCWLSQPHQLYVRGGFSCLSRTKNRLAIVFESGDAGRAAVGVTGGTYNSPDPQAGSGQYFPPLSSGWALDQAFVFFF